MSNQRWSELASRIEQETPLSERQAEVFVLTRLGEYQQHEVAEILDISPTTVSRHAAELDTKLDHAETLAGLDERLPYCTCIGSFDETFISPSVSIYENERLADGHFERPSEKYHVEVTWTEHPYAQSYAQCRWITDEFKFRDRTSILDEFSSGVFSDDFVEAACVYSALVEAFAEDVDLPPLAEIYGGEAPPEDDLRRVASRGVITAEQVRHFADTADGSAEDFVLGTHIGADIPIEFDPRDGRVSIVGGHANANPVTARQILNRMMVASEDAPTVVCLDILGKFGSRADNTYEIQDGGVDADEVFADGFEPLHHIDAKPSIQPISKENVPWTLKPDDKIAATKPSTVYARIIDAVLDRINTDGTPTYLVIAEAHVLSDETWNTLMDAADDDNSALDGWMAISPTQIHEFPIFSSDTPARIQDDGFVLHQIDQFGELEDHLSPDQRKFLRNAEGRPAEEEEPSQALVSAPGTDAWTPIEIDNSLDAIAPPSRDFL